MWRFYSGIYALVVFSASLVAQVPAGLPPFSTFLKANSSIQRVAVDAQGFLYVFGDTSPSPTTGYSQQVFVARLDPNATHLMYVTYLGGPSFATAGALAVDAAGNAYVTGSTVPSPGPTTPNAQVPFAAKVNVSGAVVYTTLFSNGVRATPQAIAVDNQGNAIVSGLSGPGFPSTPGAYQSGCTDNCPFLTKLDVTGTKLIFSAIGVGGSSLTLDAAGNIFVAGTAFQSAPNSPQYPTTPGAFQTTYTPVFYCGGLCLIGSSSVSAGEQYVTKLTSDGSRLLYSTFVTGSLGAYNAGMAVDASGDVWLTGDTASPDYPYTQAPSGTPLSGTFTTELDPTGSSVLLSVPHGVPPGNGSNLAFAPDGDLIAVGTFPTFSETTSPANVLPAPASPSTTNIPSQCLPRSASYVLRIGSKDGSVLGTQIQPGNTFDLGSAFNMVSSAVDSQGNIYVAGTAGLADIPLTAGVFYDTSVTQRTVSGAFLERTNFSLPASPIACTTDAADQTLLGPVSPGQLLTLFGNGMGPSQPVSGLVPGEASVPTTLAGVGVTFDGQPAPILYASSTQINVQAPFAIGQNPSTVMQVSYHGAILGTRRFAVAPANPGVFASVTPAGLTCGNLQIGGSVFVATALNQDGSINSCANPAAAGSEFSLLLNGIGADAGNQDTGIFTGSNPGPDIGSAAVFNGKNPIEVVAFTDLADAISGIGQVKARVPETIVSLQPMSLTVTLSLQRRSSYRRPLGIRTDPAEPGIPAGPLAPGNGLAASATQVRVVIFVTAGVPTNETAADKRMAVGAHEISSR